MKKTMLLAIAGTGFALASCNKEYKCYCHERLNDRDTVFVHYQKERSAKKATRSCENLSDSSGECSLTNK